MQSVDIQTRVDQNLVAAIPALAPLLGRRVRVTAVELEPGQGTPGSTGECVGGGPDNMVSIEEFLRHRLKRPARVAPVTLEDMEEAIIRGALDGNL